MNPLHFKWAKLAVSKTWSSPTSYVDVGCQTCLNEETNPVETDRPHEAELRTEAQNTSPAYKPHSVHVKGTDKFITIDRPQETSYVSFSPVVGIERDSKGKPTEEHKKKIGRIKEILDSYSWDGEQIDPLKAPRDSHHSIEQINDPSSEHHGKWAILGKAKKDGQRKVLSVHETEHEARKKTHGAGVLSLASIDGRQLTSVPQLEKPAEISTSGSRTIDDHNKDWDEHIRKGFAHARHLWENDKEGFKKLAAEGRKLLGGTKIWSVSSKLAKTTEEDPDIENLGIYMPPANSGHVGNRNACARCTRGCKNSCLSQSGYGGFESTQVARIRRAHTLHMAPAHFAAAMMDEMVAAHNKAQQKGAVVAFRPNATTDHPFHEWWPELFHKDHMEENNRGVRTIAMKALKGSFSYAYTAVKKILDNFANSTFSFKENNEHEGVEHLLKDKRHNSWLPLTTTDENELPHGVIFRVEKRDGSVHHVVAPTTNGDRRDDRPNDHWKSLQEPHVPHIREALQGSKFFKVTPGTVGVGTTKLPIDPKEAERVKKVGRETGFLHDVESRPPAEVMEQLPKELHGYRWNYYTVKEPEKKVSLDILSEGTRKILRESIQKLQNRLLYPNGY